MKKLIITLSIVSTIAISSLLLYVNASHETKSVTAKEWTSAYTAESNYAMLPSINTELLQAREEPSISSIEQNSNIPQQSTSNATSGLSTLSESELFSMTLLEAQKLYTQKTLTINPSELSSIVISNFDRTKSVDELRSLLKSCKTYYDSIYKDVNLFSSARYNKKCF